MSPAAARPTASSERIEFLDVLRGVALLGILMVNLPFLGLPLAEAGEAPRLFVEGGASAWTAALVRALAENKFMGLFSLLFGMGLALQVDRAEARGVNPRSFYPRRLAVLAAFALLVLPETPLAERRFDIEIAGTCYPAKALARPPYDPKGERMRA